MSKFDPMFTDIAYGDDQGTVYKKFDVKEYRETRISGIQPTAPCSLKNSPLSYLGENKFTPCQRAMIELSADFCEKKISDGDLVNRIMGWIYVGGGAISLAAGAYNQVSRIGESPTATTLTNAAAIAAIGSSTNAMKPLGGKGTVKYADLVQAATDYIKTNNWGLSNAELEDGVKDLADSDGALPDKDDAKKRYQARSRDIANYSAFIRYMIAIEDWAKIGSKGNKDKRLVKDQYGRPLNGEILADEIVVRQYYIGLFNSIAGVCATSFSSPFVAMRVDVSERSMINRALFYANLLREKKDQPSRPKEYGITIKADGTPTAKLNLQISEPPSSEPKSTPKSK